MITVLTLSDWIGMVFFGILILFMAFVFTIALIGECVKKVKRIFKRISAGGSE